MFKKASQIAAVFYLMFSLVAPAAVLAAGPAAIDLGGAGNFAILAKTGISTTGGTSVVGDIGISPAAATYITGFELSLSAGSAYSRSDSVDGEIYAPGYAAPAAANLTAAVGAMETAYTNGAGRTNPTATELGAGNIGGMTLAPGLYKWSTGVTIPTDLTLSGGANDVWIFVIAQNLTISSATKVILSGGAQYNNVFWVVAGQTTIGTTAVFNGTILDQTAIVLNTGATLYGKALAQTAVTLDASTVNIMPVFVPPTPGTLPAPTNQSSGSSGASAGSVESPQTNSASSATSANSTMTTNNTSGASATMPAPAALNLQVKIITKNLVAGNTNTNVKTLQQFLISQNKGPAAKALAKVGASAYFGALTRKALAEFQAKVGIKPASGNFGPITRAYLSTHF